MLSLLLCLLLSAACASLSVSLFGSLVYAIQAREGGPSRLEAYECFASFLERMNVGPVSSVDVMARLCEVLTELKAFCAPFLL